MRGAERFLLAARRQEVDRPPVWLMRQAGRYLPEYQAIRREYTFVERCTTPELAKEISLQPWRRFGMDGVVVFCDILMPLETLGIDFSVPEGGPQLVPAMQCVEAVQQLRIPRATEAYGYLKATLSDLQHTLDRQAAVIGFCGGPWTLAMYMTTGGRMTDREVVKQQLLTNDPLRTALFDLVVPMMADYLTEQANAGADVVQIFDTWAGILTAKEFATIAAPALTQLIANFRSQTSDEIPVTIYCNDCHHITDQLAALGTDVVSIDWRADLKVTRERIGHRVAIQGNLDPETLLTTPDTIVQQTQTMLAAGGRKGYIANLGHGVMKATPPEHVQAFVETVQAYA